FDLAGGVNDHRGLETVHAPERLAGLEGPAADGEEVELAAARLADLVQARNQLPAREAAGRGEDEHPRHGGQVGEVDELAGLPVESGEVGRGRSSLEPRVGDQRAGIVAKPELEEAELAERSRQQKSEQEHE